MFNILLKIADWFIPQELRASTAMFWRARIFAISHLLGPCSAVVILRYLYHADPSPGLPFWIIVVLCFAFWLLPFGMKLTRQLAWAAAFSVVDLTFVSVFGAYFYGGVSSPFLPWFLTALLLGFFYMGHRPLLVFMLFAVHLLAFCLAYLTYGFPELVPVENLSTVGVVSVCAATLYTSMMAVYYAAVIESQSELKQEIERHLVTAVKMQQAKEHADRANEAKAVFLAKMSHQLRTPLNAIIGYSEILIEEGGLNGGSHTEDLKLINSAGRHLLSLVSDVLYMPKIEAEDIDLCVELVDLKQLLEDVASTCRQLVVANGNEFLLDLSPDVGLIATDQTRLRQILINLLSNAGKFTSCGVVTLCAQRQCSVEALDEVVISVQDTGIGIAQNSLDQLFVEFNQAHESGARPHGGTGLGLAVSRKLCQVLDATIEVSSELGKGSKFTVRIPSAPRVIRFEPTRDGVVRDEHARGGHEQRAFTGQPAVS